MKEFFNQYGFLGLMLVVCLGSHFFMHRGGGHGSHGDHDGHCGADGPQNTNAKEGNTNGYQVNRKN